MDLGEVKAKLTGGHLRVAEGHGGGVGHTVQSVLCRIFTLDSTISLTGISDRPQVACPCLDGSRRREKEDGF